jgi:hypothetical protein
MRTSEQINELAAALAAAQSEMRNAKLNKVNPHFKSRYADLAEIRDTVTPALSKHGIALAQGTDTTDGGIVVVTKLIHKSGQWIESRFPIAYDKPQTMGSAYTYARRYSISAMCSISAEEDDDAEAANDKPVAPVKSFPKPGSVHPERTRSEPDTATITGTANVPKNAEAKQLYETLVREMEMAKTLEALKTWLNLRRADINSLPAEWMEHFDEAYGFRRNSLESVRAA